MACGFGGWRQKRGEEKSQGGIADSRVLSQKTCMCLTCCNDDHSMVDLNAFHAAMVGMWSGNNWAGTAADVAYHSRKEELLQVMFDLNIEAILGVRDDALAPMLTDILQEAAVHKGNIKDTRAGKLFNDLFSRSEPLISYSLPAVLNENGESIDNR